MTASRSISVRGLGSGGQPLSVRRVVRCAPPTGSTAGVTGDCRASAEFPGAAAAAASTLPGSGAGQTSMRSRRQLFSVRPPGAQITSTPTAPITAYSTQLNSRPLCSPPHLAGEGNWARCGWIVSLPPPPLRGWETRDDTDKNLCYGASQTHAFPPVLPPACHEINIMRAFGADRARMNILIGPFRQITETSAATPHLQFNAER